MITSREITNREQEVLELLLEANADKEISRRLGISVPTVRFHINNIFRKMAVRTRAELMLVALRSERERDGANLSSGPRPSQLSLYRIT